MEAEHAMERHSDPLLSILIAVSRRVDLLAECLASLRQFVPAAIPHEIIVVLNEAEPASVGEVRAAHPDVTFIPTPVNLGMAGSANLARRHASGRFLVTLHDDAVIEPGWAEALLAAAHAYPHAGAIGSKVLFPDGRLQTAGALLWRSGQTTPPWNGAAPNAADIMTPRPVDYCGTCSLLVRTVVFDAVGGFDETIYPAYYVDVDLGLALRSQGYYVLCEPRSVIRHHRGASSGAALKQVASQRNRDYLLRKWKTAIASHEAPPRPGEAFAVEAALRRAAEFAGACEADVANPVPPEADVRSVTGDSDGGVVDRHSRLSCELSEAVIAHLEAALVARDVALAQASKRTGSRLATRVRRWRQALANAVGRFMGS